MLSRGGRQAGAHRSWERCWLGLIPLHSSLTKIRPFLIGAAPFNFLLQGRIIRLSSRLSWFNAAVEARSTQAVTGEETHGLIVCASGAPLCCCALDAQRSRHSISRCHPRRAFASVRYFIYFNHE
jgi:hypothetical protein